ncbi:MAG: DNA mismatch repair protein MutS [Cryomorphaceae bacterium]|jgi:DNA mismatch repair protein MutS|nr:DNA mismatch repair protein MutS [Cryomorphaceae bacterium]MBT3503034.1 DNA mismatch repair protein MutS [Cryomorphaceae bacterium]MBT4222117.1 DNA mismatch repair protein MutS [Cryomorphaceae bacterium]MBT4517390.1 DNA mismatch repair protein MutS [Cryomorphaceae bacterium]MBT4834153.1 DNA mismatch repair protein MutS [Cryomorphaceae bacterium]
MKQYNDIKLKYPNTVLLFRVGDFYETFGQDAVLASKVLGIVLTKRGAGSTSETELAGFPHHSIENYLPKLVKAGHRVAICDQLEDPKLTKKIVKRGVIEIVTPGIVINDGVLDQKKNNYLASIYFEKNECGISFLDVSTGDFYISQGDFKLIDQLISNFSPNEILVSKPTKNKFNELIGSSYNVYPLDDWVFDSSYSKNKLLDHFNTKSLKGFGVDDIQLGITAAGSIIHYLDDTEHNNLSHISNLQRIFPDSYVWMDKFTMKNLELFNSNSLNGFNLSETIDDTITSMGSRRLKNWIAFPLVEKKEIKNRQEIVSSIIEDNEVSDLLDINLNKISDIERLMSKIATYKISPRELIHLKNSLESVYEIKQSLSDVSGTLKSYGKTIPVSNSIVKEITKTLKEDSPVSILKGDFINDNYSNELDELRDIRSSGKEYLNQILERETEKTKIPSLKISFNNVFGYYIEVRNTHKDKVPEEWIRKQTLVNAERYITQELKEYEEKIINADEKIKDLELKLFLKLIDKLQDNLTTLKLISEKVSVIDILNSFSKRAIKYKYICPEIIDKKKIEITQGRHPVIEANLPHGERYIPNDILLDKEQQIIMITGPNMSGKSAILRQTALITILAQIGSFVPAKEMKFSIVDRIFTRVGASDNISMGESTFMVEMNETASILNNLTDHSLILLDEIGRGTSTYDGISIAWAIAEFLHENKNNPHVLFATHYHDLNEMESIFKGIKNFNVSVKETKDDVVFLRKLVKGGSNHSFGIHVAKMAGMPKLVLDSAKNKLKLMERASPSKLKGDNNDDNFQLSFFDVEDPKMQEIRKIIENLDIDNLSPVEALIKLNQIKKEIKNED